MDIPKSLENLILRTEPHTIKNFLSQIEKYNSEVLSNALIYCIQNNKYFLIRALVEKGADIHYKDDEPLFEAIKISYIINNVDLIMLLIELGADPNARNGQFMLDLINQISNNTHQNVIIYNNMDELVQSGYDVNINDNAATILAAEKKLWNVVRSLVIRGANIYARNNYVLNIIKNNPSRDVHYSLLLEIIEGSAGSIKIKGKPIKISKNPVSTTVTNPNIKITCNQGNIFEGDYPICPISIGKIPQKMLVAVGKISDLKNWKAGQTINTQCFDARSLYNYWYSLPI